MQGTCHGMVAAAEGAFADPGEARHQRPGGSVTCACQRTVVGGADAARDACAAVYVKHAAAPTKQSHQSVLFKLLLCCCVTHSKLVRHAVLT